MMDSSSTTTMDSLSHRSLPSPPARASTISFDLSMINTLSRARDYEDDDEQPAEEADELEDNRLASLEALRHALHHAPFCRNMHRLMSVPTEEFFEMQGIPTKCAIRISSLSCPPLLNDVSLNVPKGKIYALLGSAQNGKSALLRCLVGRIRPREGTIEIFNSIPNTVSGICVGYVPQRVSLHEELSIEQTLFYYGRLYQLQLFLIFERIELLRSMLSLPHKETKIGSLNPGQKWRISLAVALIHSPPLLLLDEPTDNVDPMIRHSIWSRLTRLCDEEGLTVFVTTKCPGELGFAYKAGLMHNGHVYAEGHPEELRQYYTCDTYDEMFTKFCTAAAAIRTASNFSPYISMRSRGEPLSPLSDLSNQSIADSQHTKTVSPKTTLTISEDISPSASREHETHSGRVLFPIFESLGTHHEHSLRVMNDRLDCQPDNFSISSNEDATDERMHRRHLPMAEWPICERRRVAHLARFINFDSTRLLALIKKNLTIMRGNCRRILVFYFLFPALQILLVCSLFGRPITNIPVSVPFPQELPKHGIGSDYRFVHTFVRNFLERPVFVPSFEESVAASIKQVQLGRAWMSVVPWSSVPGASSNESSLADSTHPSLCTYFTAQVNQTLETGLKPGELPSVRLFVDTSNYVITHKIFYSFIKSIRDFLRSHQIDRLFADCPEVGHALKNRVGIDLAEVIYGSTKFQFLEFLLPGFLVSIIFSYSIVLTAFLFIREIMTGQQERCLITGTSGMEILIAHFVSQLQVFFAQQALLLVIVLYLFGLPSRGPLYALWALIFLLGMVGILLGLFVAVICPTPRGAIIFTWTIFIPAFFFSGIIWPIESMHPMVNYVSHLLPLTQPINSVRYLIARGPDMNYSRIFDGFSVAFLYISFLLVATIIIFKCKTSS